MANLQDTVKNLINNEVLACQSSLVNHLLGQETEGFSIDDIENLNRVTYPNQYVYTVISGGPSDKVIYIYKINEETGEPEDKLARIINETEFKMAKQQGYDLEYVDDLSAHTGLPGIILEDPGEIEPEYEPQEIMEWWLVGGRLADDLRDIGAPILDNEHGTWWGRTETGQSLEMDSDLNRVAKDLIERA